MQRSRRQLAALLVLLASSAAAHGGLIAMPPPGPARVANADTVIVGRVEALEPQDVKVGNITYRIAVVRITDKVRGVKDEKTLRVGFMPQMPVNPMIFVSGPKPIQLTAGQEGLFLLTKHAKEPFYTIGGVVGYLVNKEKNDGFAKEVEAAKLAAKVMDNPQAALKAKDADERLLAAAILIDKHRTYRGSPKLEPIDADESKQLMQVLADSDWKAQDNLLSLRPSPLQLFQRLGVTAKDGFTVPKGGDYQAAVQTWVRGNVQTYRIQRYAAKDAK